MKADLDMTLREIVKRITPGVAEILEKENNTEMTLRFGPGGFKHAIYERVL